MKANTLFIHFNGSYHSENNEGNHLHLRKQALKNGILTITTVTQSQIKTLDEEHFGKRQIILSV